MVTNTNISTSPIAQEIVVEQFSGLWKYGRAKDERHSPDPVSLLHNYRDIPSLWVNVSTIGVSPDWLILHESKQAVTSVLVKSELLVSSLGWTKEEALETRMRLRAFEEDWEAPGMEGYDDI